MQLQEANCIRFSIIEAKLVWVACWRGLYQVAGEMWEARGETSKPVTLPHFLGCHTSSVVKRYCYVMGFRSKDKGRLAVEM